MRDRAERLEREREAHAERVRAQERARIAREMHDVVAHRVSLMVVHAGALEVTTADPATAEAAAVIRSTGRAALTDLREVLGVPGRSRRRRPPAGTGSTS
ncbi:histidine kinase dimerization/phosphoacceptor domain-containing protein [Micromonospora sp. BRA006-A]|nr:histidine kinase dimerization/phosphoacceptor domain-containing protein [Micromonospora sp. BRA006-A]